MVRNRMRYYAGFMKQLEHEVPLTEEDFNEELAAEDEIVSEDFQPEMFENIKLLEALNRISQEDLTIIKLHVLYGLSYVSIANSMGITWSAASSRYNRAINKIRKYMEVHNK